MSLKSVSSPKGYFPRPIAQLQRLPIPARIAVLSEGLAVSSQSEAGPLGMALLELAADYSGETRSGSRFEQWILGLFQAVRARRPLWREAALAEIARHWARLTPDVRRLAAATGRDRWATVVVRLATAREVPTRRAVAELCRGAADPGLTGIATELLSDTDPSVSEAAEEGLLALALIAAEPETIAWADHVKPAETDWAKAARSTWSTADRLGFGNDLAGALHSLPVHRRERILLAAMLVIEPAAARGGGGLAKWLRDRDQTSHSFLRGFLRRDVSPLSRLRAWQWLGTTVLSNAAADRVGVARSLDEHEAVLSNWHLVRNPARVAKLRQHERTLKGSERGALIPAREFADRLTVQARRGIAAVAESLDVPAEKRDEACEQALADADPLVRLGAGRACSSRMLTDFCFDRDPDVARSAALRRSWGAVPEAVRSPGSERVSEERARLAVLARSPHASVRALAGQDLESLCDAKTTTAAARVAFRRALVVDEPWVLEKLRELLREGEESRGFALIMARRLGLILKLGTSLLESVRSMLRAPASENESARVLATAVAAMGELPGPEPAELLTVAAGAADQRVRANAIDAMVQRVRSGSETDTARIAGALLEFKEDPWHRVRGSAVRGLGVIGSRSWTAGGANALMVGEQLVRMLEDQRPMHRLAGAWVADRTLPGRELREMKIWPQLVGRLRSLAVTDLEARVRARARFALARAGEAPVKSGDELLAGSVR